jgi:hypothetical protein
VPSNSLDLNALPRAIALQYDKGEIVYGAGKPPMLHEYSYNGSGLRTFGVKGAKPWARRSIRPGGTGL